jgi:hypothetical protein
MPGIYVTLSNRDYDALLEYAQRQDVSLTQAAADGVRNLFRRSQQIAASVPPEDQTEEQSHLRDDDFIDHLGDADKEAEIIARLAGLR